jgi:hypothetical protein
VITESNVGLLEHVPTIRLTLERGALTEAPAAGGTVH